MAFTQAGFYRWHDGGTSSFAFSAGLKGKAERTGKQWGLQHEIHLAYGLVKQNDVDLRKAEDVIHLFTSFTNTGRLLFGRLAPTVTIDFRSQFAPGFDYSKEDSITAAPQISDFFAPATVVETFGFQLDMFRFVALEFGAAGKHTFVRDPMLRSRYKVAPSRVVRNELGLSTRIQIEKDLFTNVHLDHALTLFASFNKPDAPDLLSETHVTMTVNRWLHVNLEYVAKLDRDVSRSLQMKELISLGVTLVLI